MWRARPTIRRSRSRIWKGRSDSIKKRYAQVGVGGRSMMYSRALVEQHTEQCEMVGLCDTNPGRLALRRAWVQAHGVPVTIYGADASAGRDDPIPLSEAPGGRRISSAEVFALSQYVD
jgi:hypothetical protein